MSPISSSPDRQSYETHFNYISCLENLLRGIKLRYSGSLRPAMLPRLNEKDNLIKLTKKSLSDEKKIVDIDPDYSYASTSWLPVKSYYLIFNTLLTLEYIIKLQNTCFQASHKNCIEEFTRKLSSGEIVFSEPILNTVFDASILNYKSTIGSNLSPRTQPELMYKLALRKIARYKDEEWKRKEKINLRIKNHKARHQSYLNSSFFVSIFDFPYYMRIRSNYRDFAFIDGINSAETSQYFNNYFAFTVRLVEALEGVKSDLMAMRSVRP
jgi:hypothetical protein